MLVSLGCGTVSIGENETLLVPGKAMKHELSVAGGVNQDGAVCDVPYDDDGSNGGSRESSESRNRVFVAQGHSLDCIVPG